MERDKLRLSNQRLQQELEKLRQEQNTKTLMNCINNNDSCNTNHNSSNHFISTHGSNLNITLNSLNSGGGNNLVFGGNNGLVSSTTTNGNSGTISCNSSNASNLNDSINSNVSLSKDNLIETDFTD